MSADQLGHARRSVPRNSTFHAGREPFLKRLLDLMARSIARDDGDDPGDEDIRAQILADLVDDPAVRRTLNLMWLPISPERLVRLLLSDRPTLARAADGLLSPAAQAVLLRPADAPWTVDDVPLLDEAAERLGVYTPPARTASVGDDDYRELVVVDPFARERPTTTVAERALADRDWQVRQNAEDMLNPRG